MVTRAIKDCGHCALAAVCAAQADSGRVRAGRRVGAVRAVLEPGETLYVEGCVIDSIYALRSGSIKDVATRANGFEAVVQMAIPGDVVGLAGIFGAPSATSAIALTQSSVCRLPRMSLERVVVDAPGVATELLRLLAGSIISTQQTLGAAFEQSALARVAGFLSDLSARLQRAGLDGSRFRVGVSRRDMASYLGVTIETVSRCLTELVRHGIIDVSAKSFRVINGEDLKLAAGAT